MSLLKILVDLYSKGIEVSNKDGAFKVFTSEQSLADEERAVLKENKEKIQQLFSSLDVISSSDIAEASSQQARLWFLDKLDTGKPTYNIPWKINLSGDLDVDRLESSLTALMTRNETLRSVFHEESGDVYQVIRACENYSLVIHDLASYEEKHLQNEIERISIEERNTGFDLQSDSMLRASLLRLNEKSFILLLTVHHIAADGWSVRIIVDELSHIYGKELFDTNLGDSDSAYQYSDYAHWQKQYVNSPSYQKELGYWAETLENLPELHSLPCDYTRPSIQSFKGRVYSQVLPAVLKEKLNELAIRCDSTLFMVLHAAFSSFLGRMSGAEDIVLGTAIANRSESEFEKVVGFFANTLVLRSDLSENPTVKALIQQSSGTLLDAYENQKIPFEKLVDKLNPKRDLSYSPLFQVMLVLQNLEKFDLTLPNLKIDAKIQNYDTAKYDLTLFIQESESQMALNWEYALDLFSENTIVRWASLFETFLSSMVENPDLGISQLNILSTEEQELLTNKWNGKESDIPSSQGIHEIFEGQVTSKANDIALTFGNIRVSFNDLNEQANKLAQYILEHGAKSEQPIGVYLQRNESLCPIVLGILKAGCVYLPLDATLPRDRVKEIIDDSGLELLFVDNTTGDNLGESFSGLSCDIDCPVFIDELDRYNTDEVGVNVGEDSPAYIIYTSGSTGKPKGILQTHKTLLNLVHAQASENVLSKPLVSCGQASISFDVSIQELATAWYTGSELVLATDSERTSPSELSRLIHGHKIERLFIAPAMLHALLEDTSKNNWLVSLKEIVVAGEAIKISPMLKNYLNNGKARLINHYGPSETHVITHLDITDAPIGYAAIGKPVANHKLYVLDKHSQIAPIGVAGELYVAGAGLAREYLGSEALTQEKFVSPGLISLNDSPLPRLYKTGDLVRWIFSGNLEFIGRADNQVKIRGHRVEIGEVESRISNHPSVRSAVVMHVEYHDTAHLIAYVVWDESQALQTSPTECVAELKDSLGKSLPTYMVPAAFVSIGSIPLNKNGKVDKSNLPKYDFGAIKSHEYIPPSGNSEIRLSKIWEEVLHVSNIGVMDNFFSLGGNSLLAMRLTAKIRDEFNLELNLKNIFESPNIADLSTLLDDAAKDQSDKSAEFSRDNSALAIHQAPKQDCLPLSYAQRRLWIVDKIEPDSFTFNMPRCFEFEGSIDSDALHSALDVLIERHKILRTVYRTENDEPVQKVVDKPLFEIQRVDLSNLPNDVAIYKGMTLAREEARRPFNLAQDLMLRASLIKINEEHSLFLLTTHHIASDGWSMGIMFSEINQAYNEIVLGRTPKLPNLPVQYLDYAWWQHTNFNCNTFNGAIEYWKDQLKSAPPTHGIPLDRPRPQSLSHVGGFVNKTVSKSCLEKLYQLANKTDSTLFMVLNAVYASVLHRYSSDREIVVGTSIANREQIEVAGSIGFFVNHIILHSTIEEGMTFSELLQQSHDRLLKAYEYQQLPFEVLVDELNPERSLNHNPIFQVTLVLQENENTNLSLNGIRCSIAEETYAAAKYDLTLAAREDSGGLKLTWGYAEDLFDKETIEGMALAFHSLLNEVVKDADKLIESCRLNSAIEESYQESTYAKTLLSHAKGKFNSDANNPLPLNSIFESSAARFPNRTAVIYGDCSITFEELNRRSNQLANYLIEDEQIEVNDLVGLCMNRSVESIVALLGVMKSGAAYVPLDPGLPQSRLQYHICDAELKVLITQKNVLEKLPSSNSVTYVVYPPLEGSSAISDKLESEVSKKIELSNSQRRAYVIYTSGSTGKPKGVVVNHENLLNLHASLKNSFEYSTYIESQDQPTWGLNAPLSFDSSVKGLLALFSGMTLNIVPEDVRADGEAFAEYIKNSNLDFLDLTPSHLNILLETFEEGEPGLFPSNLVIGGEVFTENLKDKLFDKQFGFDGRVFNVYGPTECTVNTTISEIACDKPVRIGRLLDNLEAFVLSPGGDIQPVGCAGELCVGGRSVAEGYLNRPALTHNKFIGNPYLSHALGLATNSDRLYKTGDLVRQRNDGSYEFIGRVDDQVKIRGYRIELGEIESSIQSLDWVLESRVLIVGDGDLKKIAAFIVCSNAVPEGAKGQVDSFLKSNLPDYMIPNSYQMLDRIPVNENGKLDRAKLQNLVISSVARDKNEKGADTEGVLKDKVTRTQTESLLIDEWRALLGVEFIEKNDNFFHLGGHSLMAVRLIGKLKRKGIRITSRELFHNPTVVSLGQLIDEKKSSKSPAKPRKEEHVADTDQITGKYPVLVNDYWTFQRRDYNHWNTSKIWEVTGSYSPKILKTAFSLLMEHHDGLRRKWELEDGKWYQIFQKLEEMNSWWSEIDLREYESEQQDVLLADEYVRVQTTLDITQSLIKIVYFDLGENRHPQILFVLNHLLVDGFSFGILMDDFQVLCDNLKALPSSKSVKTAREKLPEKTASIKELTEVYQARAAHKDVTEIELGYWNSIEWDRYRKLPIDSEPEMLVPNTGTSAPVLIMEYLNESDTEKFDNIARHSKVTQEDIILTALVLAYGDWSGSRMLGVTLSNHGRAVSFDGEELDLTRTIGCLNNFLFRVFEVDDNATPRDALYAIKSQREILRGREANYSLLRFLHADGDVRHQMEYLPTPQLDQNFVPRHKSAMGNGVTGFKRALEVMGANCAELNSLFRPFSTVYHCNDTDRLIVQWAYCPSMYTSSTASSLAKKNAEYIRVLIHEFYEV